MLLRKALLRRPIVSFRVNQSLMYESPQVPYETKVVSIGVSFHFIFGVTSGLQSSIDPVYRLDSDPTSSSTLLAIQETCTGCERDNQMSAISFCSLSALQVRQFVTYR